MNKWMLLSIGLALACSAPADDRWVTENTATPMGPATGSEKPYDLALSGQGPTHTSLKDVFKKAVTNPS